MIFLSTDLLKYLCYVALKGHESKKSVVNCAVTAMFSGHYEVFKAILASI
jgi:hypothetical protein